MKMMRLPIVISLVWLVASTAPAQLVKLGTVAPEGSPWHAALTEISAEWAKISGGKLQLRIYAGGVAGDESDMLRKMGIGQLQAAAFTSTTLISLVPDMEVLTFPLQFETDEELLSVIELLAPRFEKALEAKGYKVVVWSYAGWARFFSKEPTITPVDFSARKLFYWGSDAKYLELLKDTGFKPVPLAVTDLLPSLQTGLVDTFGAPPAAALSFQWFGLAKHMTDLRWQPIPTVIIVSLRTWSRIAPELQVKLEEATEKIARKLWTEAGALDNKAIEAMKGHGLTVHPASPEVRQEWKALVEKKGLPMFLGSRFSEDVYRTVEKHLQDLRGGGSASGSAAP